MRPGCSHPSLDVKLFRDPRLSSAVGALGLVFFGMMGALFFLSFYLQSVRGYSPLYAGVLTLPFAAGQMLMAPRSARLVRRYGTKAVAASGLLTVAVALAGYLLLGMSTPIWVLGVIFFIQGAGMGTVMPPATEAVMSVVPRERAGSGSALTNTARQVAGALGVAVLGLDPGPGLPRPAQPAPDRAARRRPERRHRVHHRHPDRGLPAGRRGTAPRPVRRRRLRARDARHHGISAAITLVGALVVLIWMPGRPAAEPPWSPRPRRERRRTAGLRGAGGRRAGRPPRSRPLSLPRPGWKAKAMRSECQHRR